MSDDTRNGSHIVGLAIGLVLFPRLNPLPYAEDDNDSVIGKVIICDANTV
jgi:hypothetical protein